MLEKLIAYPIAFVIGGLICALAQILIIKTKLTPARILVIFLVIGIVLEGVGLYAPINKFAQAGISVPIIGFGAALTRGAIKATAEYGFLGAFAGGLAETSLGIGVAIVASYLVTLIFSPKSKQ